MIKLVVFDMAGTTVDEDNVVYKTLHKAINEAGVDATFEDVLFYGAGKEKLKAIKDILLSYGVVNNEVTTNAFKYFLAHLAVAYDVLLIKPQLGATDVFAQLQKLGIKVVLNTGYNKNTAQLILNKLNWQVGNQIDGLVTASDVLNNRPMPDMIYLAMQQHGITDTKLVVKVGDSAIDIEEGKNAGCGLSIGITTGAHTVEQLQSAQPDYIINNLAALIPIISSI
jgi:phosphonatase-like hydrolase